MTKPTSKMSPCQRAARYEEAEIELRRRLKGRGGPVTAKTLAAEIGWPWRVVARALQRMSAKGGIKRGVDIVKYDRGRHWEISAYVLETDGFDMDRLPAWLRGAVARQTNEGKG